MKLDLEKSLYSKEKTNFNSLPETKIAFEWKKKFSTIKWTKRQSYKEKIQFAKLSDSYVIN